MNRIVLRRPHGQNMIHESMNIACLECLNYFAVSIFKAAGLCNERFAVRHVTMNTSEAYDSKDVYDETAPLEIRGS